MQLFFARLTGCPHILGCGGLPQKQKAIEFFFDRDDYKAAVFWYENALSAERQDAAGGFVIPDCYGYIPCMQLCVCHYRLGDTARAIAYNERAGTLKPEDPAYLYNKAFFDESTAE